MATLLTIVCFLFLVMETFTGMVANGSIVLINFIDWFRKRKLSTTDLILICLGSSRFLLQAVMVLDVTLFTLLNNTRSNLLLTRTGVWVFMNTVNLWLAACLSVFYLAKIAIFSHPVFLQVKRRLSGLVPWLLLGSVIASVVRTLIVTTNLSTCGPYKSLSSNRTNAEMNTPQRCSPMTALTAVFDVIPFMAFLSSSIFLISSLWKHMRCLQGNGTGTRDPNTEAHWSAIKALASFAVLYMISFAAVTSQLVLAWKNQHTWRTLLFNVSSVYPFGHAIILILINLKLKQTWVRILHHFKCHLSELPS